MSVRDAARLMQVAPRVNDAVDARTLALDADLAYLLSRVDGVTTGAELADLLGRSEGEIAQLLARLADTGALRWDGYEPQRAAAPPPDDLTPEERAFLEQTERRLSAASHWEALGLRGSPSAAEVKRAYFIASKQFHPDRYFGKRLGAYGPRLEAIFLRVKAAYDVLGDEAARQAYARGVPPPPADPDLPGDNARALAAAAAATAAAEAETKRLVEQARAEERAREERLEQRRKQILEERRARFGQALKREVRADPQKAREMFERGVEQLKASDVAAAATSFQLAATYDPANAEYQARSAELAREAASIRAKRLIEAGDTQLAVGNVKQAADAYAQASDLVPANTGYAQRAAEELLAAKDLTRAWAYAERALAQPAPRLEVRLVAAAILEKKGDTQGALAQYVAAQALDKEDARVKKALERLSK